MQPSLIFLILMLHGLSFPVLLLSVYPCHWIGNWFLVNRIYIWLVHDFFKIHSVNLCLLIGLLWPLTFHIIICVLGLKFSILFLVFCLVFIFFLSFFFIFKGLFSKKGNMWQRHMIHRTLFTIWPFWKTFANHWLYEGKLNLPSSPLTWLLNSSV